MSEELYELLKQKDAEIAALRAVVDDLLNTLSQMYADDQIDTAWKAAHERLTDVYYRHGFKSDGRFRG